MMPLSSRVRDPSSSLDKFLLTSINLAWSGGLQIDDFVDISIKGRANGDAIAHRENGTLAEVNLAKGRGVAKMKATITQRFNLHGIPVDIDCDCRFIFFCKMTENGWKARWAKLVYEKDKLIPVDGKTVPEIPQAELDKYTEGNCDRGSFCNHY